MRGMGGFGWAGNWMPMGPRDTRWSGPISWLYTVATVFEGMANPTPAYELVSVRMAVLMPTTSPAMFTSGPPEFPGLIAASGLMNGWNWRWGDVVCPHWGALAAATSFC